MPTLIAIRIDDTETLWYHIQCLSWVDDRVSSNRNEESPDSTGRDAG